MLFLALVVVTGSAVGVGAQYALPLDNPARPHSHSPTRPRSPTKSRTPSPQQPSSSCPDLNYCNGNGDCGAGDECSCYTGWVGADCSTSWLVVGAGVAAAVAAAVALGAMYVRCCKGRRGAMAGPRFEEEPVAEQWNPLLGDDERMALHLEGEWAVEEWREDAAADGAAAAAERGAEGGAAPAVESCTSTPRGPRPWAMPSPASPSDAECFVCLDRPKDSALTCGHRMCNQCATLLQQKGQPCPVCRARISRIIRLFD